MDAVYKELPAPRDLESLKELLSSVVEDCYLAFRNIRDGKPADYIPALAKVDPDLFAVSVCTVDGAMRSAGQHLHRFTLQSASKPFLYGAALSRLGEEAVLEKVGVEPSGQTFNSLIRLDESSNKPHNPMINAGAIATAGLLVKSAAPGEDILSAAFGPYLYRSDIGSPIKINTEVFSSEVSTGHRNLAIGHLLKFHQILEGDVEQALDLYFKACSVEVNTDDLALMAATLANHGVNPRSGLKALSSESASKVLSVMFNCGLYDYSGEFAFLAGIPAKSGVSGTFLAVVPGVMGIALYSPRVDKKGNSIRSMGALPFMSEKLGLHVFYPLKAVPENPPVDTNRILQITMNKLQEEVSSIAPGEPAKYLKKFPETDTSHFSAVICTVDGGICKTGDDVSFSIQAAIHPFVFGHVIEARGIGAVLDAVGLEPSGNPFNSISLQPDTMRPYNPLSNAGALAIDSLLEGLSVKSSFAPLLERIRELAGDPAIDIDEAILQAEKDSSDRNKAIAHMLQNCNILNEISKPLGVYFRQCALRMNASHVARMAAVLANGGVVPGSDKKIFEPLTVQQILSVMYTCGLYDYSGRFAYDVGIPAKTGISGITFGVVPGKFGVAVYAPGVESHGNSVRGIEYLRRLSNELDLNVFSFKNNA